MKLTRLSDRVQINSDSLYKILFVLLVISFLFLGFQANSDLSEDRYALFMDELISYDGISSVIHSDSISHLVFTLIDQNDHRYGRIFWNIPAIISFIPESFEGEKAQIISTRMVFLCTLLIGYIILLITFIKTWGFRVIGLALFLTLPTTVYLSTMPKVEPFQLLFLSLFLYFFLSKKQTSLLYWVFLGLAFGSKIATLPLIPFFLILFIIQNRRETSIHLILKKSFFTGLFTLLGWIIAEPVLISSAITRSMYPIKSYFLSTFLNTTHGSDDFTITWIQWLIYSFSDYLPVHSIFLIILFIMTTIIVFFYFIFLKHRYPESWNSFCYAHNPYLIVIISGLLLLVPVFISIHRLWPHYIHIGIIFVFVACLAISEQIITSRNRWAGNNIIKSLTYLQTGLLILCIIFCMIPMTVDSFQKQAERTKTSDYLNKQTEYEFNVDFLVKIAKIKGEKISFYLDPHLFDPGSTEYYSRNFFWGLFMQWGEGKDVIIFYRDNHDHRDNPLPPKSSISYNEILIARDLLISYVDNSGSNSDPSKYWEYQDSPEKIAVFIKNSLNITPEQLQT